MGKYIDLTGQRFGGLVVIKRVQNDNIGHTRWICKCDCGEEKNILSTHLIRGNSKSCGCRLRK